MEAMLERSDPVNLIFGQIPRGMNPRLLGAASTWLQLAFSMAACGGENEPPESEAKSWRSWLSSCCPGSCFRAARAGTNRPKRHGSASRVTK